MLPGGIVDGKEWQEDGKAGTGLRTVRLEQGEGCL
jgi:hypothetical protein